MAQLVWTSAAIKDLNLIAENIEMDSEIAAKKFIKEIISKAEGLASQPFKGRPIPEKIPGGYRQILHKSYRIIYRVEELNIFISSIYHQKKLLFKL
ncbi:MAG TPA: type II toxin-antitoxin system RelE/ParE family toxin [Hanamia sp.]|nr:type II toxin-antitoxin system RelE/ParE family toxin [Hanamia sp.]